MLKNGGHSEYKCKCNNITCMFCEGGLFSCIVCHGFEGSLTTECSEMDLTDKDLDLVYTAGLDFTREKGWHRKEYNICTGRALQLPTDRMAAADAAVLRLNAGRVTLADCFPKNTTQPVKKEKTKMDLIKEIEQMLMDLGDGIDEDTNEGRLRMGVYEEMEQEIHMRALTAIAEGHLRPVTLARMAIKATDLVNEATKVATGEAGITPAC